MVLTEQQKKEKVRDLRPIDDVFFEVLAQNISVCQEMLRTIMENDNLVVTSVVTQSDERNLYGRSVRLDALCKLGNRTIYHVEKILRETGEFIDDGLHEIFVNTVINDGTDIAELMSCFTKKEVKNDKFPALSSEVKRLKETEGGVQVVCEVMQKYVNLEVHKLNIEKIQKMILKGCTKEFILELDYTEDEYIEAEARIIQEM